MFLVFLLIIVLVFIFGIFLDNLRYEVFIRMDLVFIEDIFCFF